MPSNIKQFDFYRVIDSNLLNPLKQVWRKSLTSPQDGMWEIFTEYANQYAIRIKDKTIGYACVDGNNRLLQFFILPSWMHEATSVFPLFIHQEEIKVGLIGTNNPVFLSTAMHFQKSVKVDTYLFTDILKMNTDDKKGKLKMAGAGDLENLVDFYHGSMDGPKEWLNGYLGNLIEKGELFYLQNGKKVLGACEVRRSESQPTVADIGMVASVAHRRQGLGTYLLGKAKEIAVQWNRSPICSCEKDNTGSLKCIQNNGFRSIHQMLLMEF